MPFDKNGKWYAPKDVYEEKKKEAAKQASFNAAVKSLGALGSRPQPEFKPPTFTPVNNTTLRPSLTFEDYTKGLDLNEKQRNYAGGWLSYLTSPVRYLMNETLGGKAIQRTSEKAGDAAFLIARRPEDYTDTGSNALNKAADIAGFGVGSVSNPGGTGVGSAARSLAGLTKDAASFVRGTADEIIGGAALRNPTNLTRMQQPVMGTTERLLSNLVTRHSSQLARPTGADLLKNIGKATAGSFGMDALQGAQTPNTPLEDRSFASKVGASLRAGTGDLVDSLGSVADWTGNKDLGDKLHKSGRNIRAGYELPAQEFTWKSLLDPNFYATNVARSLPTTAALIPLGVGGAVGGAAAGARLGYGAFGRTVMGAIGASAASRPVESALEASQTYQEALRRGLSESEADKAANEVFRDNLGLMLSDAAQLGMAFMPTPFKEVGKIGKAAITATKIGAGAAAEGGEEAVQEVIQRRALNDPVSWDSDMKEAVVIGALLGGGMGMAGVAQDVMRNVQKKAFESMSDEAKKAYQAIVNQNVQSGMTPEQAQAAAMDAHADTEEGRKNIERAAKQVQKEADQALQDVYSSPRNLETYIRNLPEQRVQNIRNAFATRLQQAVANNDIEQASHLQNRIRIFEDVLRGGNVPNDLLESYMQAAHSKGNQLGMTDSMPQTQAKTPIVDPSLLMPGATITFKGQALKGDWVLVDVQGDKAIVKRPNGKKTRAVPLKQVKEIVPPIGDKPAAEEVPIQQAKESISKTKKTIIPNSGGKLVSQEEVAQTLQQWKKEGPDFRNDKAARELEQIFQDVNSIDGTDPKLQQYTERLKQLYGLSQVSYDSYRVLQSFIDEKRVFPWESKSTTEQTQPVLQEQTTAVNTQGANRKPAEKTIEEKQKELLNGIGTKRKEKVVVTEEKDQAFKQTEPILPEGTKGFFGKRANLNLSSKGNKTISRVQVINNMRKNLQFKETGSLLKKLRSKRSNTVNLVIDSGRTTRGLLGEYKVQPEVIRTAQAEDIATIAHEVGHHLQKKFSILDVNSKQFDKELLPLGLKTSMTSYTPSEIREEGLAEYVRLYLTDPEQAAARAPQFASHFFEKLPVYMKNGLQSTQRDIETWINQGALAQARGLIDFDSTKKEKFSWSKVYTEFVDDLNPLKIVEEALKGKLGIGADSVYKMARLSRGVGEKAKLAVTRGIYDNQGNKMTDGLADIIKPLEKMGFGEKELAMYLVAKHSQDLRSLGKQTTYSEEHIDAVLKAYDTPEMREVQKKIIEYNNHLLNIMVDAELLTQKAVDTMKEKYPNYVPFMRYFDDDAIAGFRDGGFGATKGFVNLTNPIKRMSEEGSQRTIINPLESMVKNTFLVMNAAAKNRVGLQLAELAKIEGAGAWIEKVDGGRSGREHIITVFEKGKGQAYKIRDPELYQAMLSLDHESSIFLVRFLGGAAGMLRAGATLTPEFILRNPMRDVVSATINGAKYGFNPIDFFRGLAHVWRKTEEFDRFMSSGGGYATMMSLDRDANREALKKVFKKSMKDKAINIVTNKRELLKLLSGYTPAKKTIDILRSGSEITELATKVGAFNKAYKKSGSYEEAAFYARDLMDFNRAGSNVRQWNRVTAFINASLQGTDKMFRSYREDKAKFLLRAGLSLVLPAFILFAMVRGLDDENKKVYDNIPQWQKDTFWIIPVGNKTFLRIPKPFEAGVLFATGTERVLNKLFEDDPDAFKDYGKVLLDAFFPPVLMSALTPAIEGITNYSFFKNRSIVPMADQRFEKKDQYGIYTSQTAKVVGEILSHTPLYDSNFASPYIIDNTIRGYTAGLGGYAVSMIDAVLNKTGVTEAPPVAEKKLTEKPILRAFFANTGGGGQVREDFYDKWNELEAAKASANRNGEPFRNPEYFRMKAAKNIIDKQMKVYKTIQNSKTLLPEQKRARLDKLDEVMNQVARRGLGKE